DGRCLSYGNPNGDEGQLPVLHDALLGIRTVEQSARVYQTAGGGWSGFRNGRLAIFRCLSKETRSNRWMPRHPAAGFSHSWQLVRSESASSPSTHSHSVGRRLTEAFLSPSTASTRGF